MILKKIFLLLILFSTSFAYASEVVTDSDYYVAPGVKRVKTSVSVVLPGERALPLSDTVLLSDLPFGARGQDVRYLQEFLTRESYKVGVSGIFGIKTRTALRQFQKANSQTGLDVTGQLDANTRALINRMLKN